MLSIFLFSLSSYRYCVYLSFLIPHHLLSLPEEQHLQCTVLGITALDGFEVRHFNPEKKPRQFLKGLSQKNIRREVGKGCRVFARGVFTTQPDWPLVGTICT